MIGSHTAVDELVRTLVNRSQCAILSRSTIAWLSSTSTLQRSMTWCFIDGERLALGGDSSGANLAAAASIYLRDFGGPGIQFPLLVYPALDANYETASHQRFGDGFASALSTGDVRWFHNPYVNAPEELS
jgi:acetyl esterase/lipase